MQCPSSITRHVGCPPARSILLLTSQGACWGTPSSNGSHLRCHMASMLYVHGSQLSATISNHLSHSPLSAVIQLVLALPGPAGRGALYGLLGGSVLWCSCGWPAVAPLHSHCRRAPRSGSGCSGQHQEVAVMACSAASSMGCGIQCACRLQGVLHCPCAHPCEHPLQDLVCNGCALSAIVGKPRHSNNPAGEVLKRLGDCRHCLQQLSAEGRTLRHSREAMARQPATCWLALKWFGWDAGAIA
jgi:hypothetical protein